MTPPLALLAGHLGGLHPYEQLLVLLLAFGPFVVLGVVVAVQRRRAIAEEDEQRRANERGTPGRPGSPPSAP